MAEIRSWMDSLSGKLQAVFGSRLLFVGLQGSYGRGEATEDSDIDVVTVLDRVERADLDAYRAVVRELPEGEKACGFLCGVAELNCWPRYDLLAVARDTRDVYGKLADLLPPFGRADLAQAVSVGASGLYHAAVHTYLYAPRETLPEFLAGTEKSVFFILRDLYELRTGETVRTRRELRERLAGDERALLFPKEERPEDALDRLLRWCGGAMAEAAERRS